MNTAASNIKLWISGAKSGKITPNNAALAVEVLNMAEMLEGFAKRLRELHTQKDLSQTELSKLAGLHCTHIGCGERGAFLTKKNLRALAR